MEVRLSYLRFPRWTQPVWTWITGKPLPNERPLWCLHPGWSTFLSVAGILIFSWLHMALLTGDNVAGRVAGVLLLPVFALGLTGSWRKLQVVYAHHAIHGTMFVRHRAWNAVAAKCLTIFALVQNEEEYAREHLHHHRCQIFTTLADADARLLYRLGIRPGRSLEQLRRTLALTLVSPVYHAWFLGERIKSNLRRPPGWRLAALCWMGVVFIGLPLYAGWAVLLAVWLPLVVLYQDSALLQFATEHVWLQDVKGPEHTAAYSQRNHGRFCGELVPSEGTLIVLFRAWIGWWVRLLVVHLPVRVCVLVGDLPAHDWHHLCAPIQHSPKNWPSANYERQRAIDSGRSAGMEERELWGAMQMVEHVLLALSRAPVLPPPDLQHRSIIDKDNW